MHPHSLRTAPRLYEKQDLEQGSYQRATSWACQCYPQTDQVHLQGKRWVKHEKLKFMYIKMNTKQQRNSLLTPRFTIMWKFRRPPLFDQETKVLITHCVLRKCPRPPVSTCLGVAPTKSMCTKKSYNFSIRESHAFSNQRTQMLLVGTLRANKTT